jgi:inorganic pyrophosphatase
LLARAIKELEEFFLATNALEAKTLKFLGWGGPAKAIKTIKKASTCIRRVFEDARPWDAD